MTYAELLHTIENKAFQAEMYHFALKLTLNVANAKDLRQEVMEHLLRNYTKWDPKKGTFKSWVYRIMYNKFIDEERRKKTRGISRQQSMIVSQKNEMATDIFGLIDLSTESNESLLEHKDLLNCVLAIMRTITKGSYETWKRRLKCLKKRAEGYTYEEIAAMYKLKLSLVKADINRVREELLQHFPETKKQMSLDGKYRRKRYLQKKA